MSQTRCTRQLGVPCATVTNPCPVHDPAPRYVTDAERKEFVRWNTAHSDRYIYEGIQCMDATIAALLEQVSADDDAACRMHFIAHGVTFQQCGESCVFYESWAKRRALAAQIRGRA